MEIKYFKYKLCYELEKSSKKSEHGIQPLNSTWIGVEGVGYV